MGIEIATELEFDNIDRFGLAAFLKTRAGLRLIPKVLEACPVLLSGGEVNALLVRNGEVRGFSMAIQALLSLAEPPPKEPPAEPSAYPGLTDDSAWADGLKMESSLHNQK